MPDLKTEGAEEEMAKGEEGQYVDYCVDKLVL